MNFYSKELFLDQFTPFQFMKKIKKLYKDEITFYLKVQLIQIQEITLIYYW